MAGEQHPVQRKYAGVAHRLPETYRRYIGGGDDAAHAGDRSGARDVQLADQGVRPAAAQHLSEQHAGQREVGGVDVLSGDLADAIQAGQALAGDATVVCVHGLAPSTDMRSAASATASTILLIAGAPAQCARDRLADFVAARPASRIFVEEGFRRQDHARECSIRIERRRIR